MLSMHRPWCSWLLLFAAWLVGPAPCAAIERHHHQKLYKSKYFSLHKTTPLPHMDIGQKGGIDEAIRHRAFDNEIIVTCFTDSAVRWMVHYGRMVQALGFDHFVVLTNDPPACDAFRKAWCSGDADGVQDGNSTCESTYPGCAWYTPAELDDAEGWTAARIMNVEALWLWRYHVAVEFLRRGVNVLMSDLDVIIHGDFYRAVKAPPLSSYQFLQMPGADSPNGGLWYIHNAHPRGPVVRMLEEAVAIGLKVLKLRKRIDFRQTPDKQEVAYLCSWTDQDVLEIAIVAASHNASSRDWWCIPEGVDASEEWTAVFGDSGGPPPRAFPIPPNPDTRRIPWQYVVGRKEKDAWTLEELRANPMAEPAAWLSETCASPEECDRQDRFVRRQALFWPPMEVKVHMLHDLPTDPPWTPGDPRDDAAQRAGPAPAVDNALYSPMWLFNGAEVMARGWATPRPEPWGLVTHLVTFSDAFGKALGGRANRQHIIQMLGLWHDPRPAPQRLLRVSAGLARAAAAQPSDHAYRRLVRALMVLAAVTDRVPVLPAFPCEAAPWIRRDAMSLHGVYDPHFFTYLRDPRGPSEGDNVLCTPMMSKGNECTDMAVMSDFHLDRDVLYPSYSHDDLSVDGLDAASGATPRGALSWVRYALGSAGADADARVLWLRGSDAAAAARIGGAEDGAQDEQQQFFAALDGALSGAERGRLTQLSGNCPDFFRTEALAFTPPPPPTPPPTPASSAAGS